MSEYLNGVNTALAAIAGLFFFRFWRQTADRLFAAFALSFWLLGAHWLLVAATSPGDEVRPLAFGMRLRAFLLLIVAIVAKNRTKRPRGG